MAIYHFSVKVISRSQGRSSVAASAYRSAEKLHDDRTGLTHNFTRKSDVVQKAILLPKGAPDALTDREALWNTVENSERRKDAQLAREVTIALPRELTPEQNWALITAFVQAQFVDRGMIADVAFHRGHSGGEEQPHAHVLLTLREVTPDGFGQKVRTWNSKSCIQTWRSQWAECCNRTLAHHGHDRRIDHRTLNAQGIDLEPQSKIGPAMAQDAMARLAEHQALARRNGERLLASPEIALTALTHQQSTFTHQDLARFVDRHTVDAAQFDTVYEKIQAHPQLISVGRDDHGHERWTSRDLLSLEATMIRQATAAAEHHHHRVVDSVLARALQSKTLSDEQNRALTHVTQGQDLACMVGFAGTGKSYLLGAARDAWEGSGYRVQGMTLSGIAAENLAAGSGIPSHTVANRLWHWAHQRECLTRRDVVVVDEAGMLGSRQMAQIVAAADRAGAKVVLVGDPEQLQAIEAGAAYRAIAERVGFVELTQIRRQRVDWQQQATRDFARERTAQGLLAYERHDNVHEFESKAAAMRGMVMQWDEVRSQSRRASQIMLAYTREEVRTLNDQARAMRRAQSELGQDHTVATARGERTFAEQDRLYFLRNEPRQLQVRNGTLGTIERIDGDRFTVRLDAMDEATARRVTFDVKDYNAIDHGYAATVYKAQGVTVDRAHVLASRYFDRHSTYVAMSRHRDGADLYVDRASFPSFAELSRVLSRGRTKDVTLDYAHVRGLEGQPLHSAEDRLLADHAKYTTPLTEERLTQAAARLAQRYDGLVLQAEVEKLQKKTGLMYSLAVQVGDEGIYRGMVKLRDQRYGVIEQERGQAKLIPARQMESYRKHQPMVVERQMNRRGEEVLRAYQPSVRQRERSRGPRYRGG